LEKYSAIVKAAAIVSWQHTRPAEQTVLGGAGIALTLVLRHLFASKSKFISDISSIGHKTKTAPGSEGYDFDEYDVIIIGEVAGYPTIHRCASHCLNTGTAGCALAARLSEDHNIRVLPPWKAGGRFVFVVIRHGS